MTITRRLCKEHGIGSHSWADYRHLMDHCLFGDRGSSSVGDVSPFEKTLGDRVKQAV